jgi:hypothetical protein
MDEKQTNCYHFRSHVAADPNPVAIVLDLVHPVGPGRGLVCKERDAGGGKPVGANEWPSREIGAGQ